MQPRSRYDNSSVAIAAILGLVNVELLVVPDCPNGSAAADLLRGALDHSGLSDVEFDITTVSSQVEADRRHFTGSPSFFVNDKDAFPNLGAAPAVACRIYWLGGRMSGLPSPDELESVIASAVSH